MRKERAVSTDLSNAKVIRYGDTCGERNSPRLGVRKRAGEDFQIVYYDGSLGGEWSEKAMANTHDVTILEEFPTYSLEELVGNAPVFLVEDNHGAQWAFTLFLNGSPYADAVFIPARMSPIDWREPEIFNNSMMYFLREILPHVDLSTVQPLFPRE